MFNDFKRFSNIVNRAEKDLKDTEAEQAGNILTFINVVKKIIRFIDRKILISCRFHYEEDDIVPILDYYPEKGIRVFLHNADHFEPLVQTLEINKVFPHQLKESSSFHKVRSGEEIYLTREGKLIFFTRSGNADDFLTHGIETNLFSLDNPREVQPIDLIRLYSDFRNEFVFNFKRALVEAIKQNENKQPILTKVIDYINGMDKDAIKENELASILEKDPNNIEALLNYADFLYVNKNELDMAMNYYNRALALDPDQLALNFNYAEFVTYAKKDGKAARDILKKMVDLYPENVGANWHFANSWMGLWGRDNAATLGAQHPDDVALFESHYLKAIELDPNNTDAPYYYNLFLHWVKRDFDAANKQSRRLIELEPQKAGSYWSLAAMMDLQNGNVDEIEQLYQKAIEVEPNDPTAHAYYYSFLSHYKKDPVRIEQELLTLMMLQPGVIWLKLEYGQFLQFTKKDLDGAEEIFREAYDHVSDSDIISLDILTNLASVQLLKGDAEAAKRNIEHALFITEHEDIIAITNYGSYGDKKREYYRKNKVDEIRLGCLYMLYAHELDATDPNQYLRQIKELVDTGVRAPGWCITIYLHEQKAAEDDHSEPKFLYALGGVITGARKPKSLEKYEPWISLA